MLSKKKKSILEEIGEHNLMNINQAISLAKKYTSKKFDESFDISVVLGIDEKKSDQQIRGVLSLPKMPDKKIKVAVFADGNDQDSAKKAGADIIAADYAQLAFDTLNSAKDLDKAIEVCDRNEMKNTH